MTDKEYKVQIAIRDVKNAESRVLEAQAAFEAGMQKASFAVRCAEAELSRETTRLKEEVSRALNNLECEKSFHALAQAELERGYEV